MKKSIKRGLVRLFLWGVVAVLFVLLLFVMHPFHFLGNRSGVDLTSKGYFVQETSDKGFVAVGFTAAQGSGKEDIWLIRTDSKGNRLWSRTFGGAQLDWGRCVRQTSDNGFVLVGDSTSFSDPPAFDIFVIKTDAEGNKVWEKTIGGPDSDWAGCILQSVDQGYVILGSTESYGAGSFDMWLIKIGPEGDKEWDRTFGGQGWDEGRSVCSTRDGGYIVAGVGESGKIMLLFKTDSKGNEEWKRVFENVSEDIGNVQQTTDEGYIVVANSWQKNRDVWLIKVGPEGKKEWERTYGGQWDEDGRSVWQTVDGGYVITGSTKSFGASGSDAARQKAVLLIKTDNHGDVEWKRAFHKGKWAVGNSVAETRDNGYIITGHIEGPDGIAVLLLKVDGSGKELWTKTFGGKANKKK
jgi:hypothetical protein